MELVLGEGQSKGVESPTVCPYRFSTEIRWNGSGPEYAQEMYLLLTRHS